MTATIDQELYRTAVQTFEDLAFLLPIPDEGPAPACPLTWVSVTFRGPFSGRILVGCSEGVLQAVAANMLGDSDAPSPTQQLDALREVANVLCGNLLPKIAGTQAIFRMEAPALCEEPPTCTEAQPAACARVCLMEGCAQVSLFLDAPLAELVNRP
jgi:hypothetical protein